LFNFPNTFARGDDTTSQIAFSSSPCIVETGSEFRLYYLGWFKGENEEPLVGMFCCQFNDFTLIDAQQNGITSLCFVFENSGHPPIYDFRKTSLRSKDFIWLQDYTESRASYYNSEALENWPSIDPHPASSLGWTWLSVIRYDDGVYYAFFNKSKTRDILGNVMGGGGTGVLYSLDGLNFYEFDKNNSERISNVKDNNGQEIFYAHPFKFENRWHMLYRDFTDPRWGHNWMSKSKYSAFSWNNIQSFNAAE